MPKKITSSAQSSQLLILGLIAILFAILYFFSLFNRSSRLFQPIAAEVDFKNEHGTYNGLEKTGQYLTSLVNVPAEQPQIPTQIFGETTESKRIEVDLTNQRLYAFEGDRKVYDFLVSTGKWGRTPTGTFTIWTKLRYTKMSGGSKEKNTYYYLPNVPFVMFFSNAQVAKSRGFSIHGTYWHNNFGTPMSHGCINMKTEEVAQIYEWATPVLPAGKTSTPATVENPGTQVIIYGEAPKN